jgi:glycosyltransferase involved in cell wall biosynthesis
MASQGGKMRIGILDHTGASLGGGTLVAAHLASLLSRTYSVDLIRDWSGFSPNQLSSVFSLDLARVNVRSCEDMWESFAVPGRYSLPQQIQRSRALTAPYDLFVYAGHWVPPFCHAKHGLIYCHFPIDLPGTIELPKDERWAQRNNLDRWVRTQGYRQAWRARMNGYDAILANSVFTAGWIERRWNAKAEVVYPPVDLNVPEVEKQNRIVSIGRFFGIERRCKGHLAQVAAFREFLARVPEDWEMWMIGSCHSEKDRAYLTAVQEAARGLPIRFLINVDRDTVLHALAGAKLFWHTAGLFENRAENPVFAEHFGMATVEAMRAGCVPVVVNSGGQKEIIENNVSGFLCEGIPELVRNTLAVVEDAALLCSVATRARRRSLDFDGRAFDRRILAIVARTLSRPPKGWATQGALNILARTTVSLRSPGR